MMILLHAKRPAGLVFATDYKNLLNRERRLAMLRNVPAG